METKLTLKQLNNVAEIDIIYLRKPACKISERPKITTSADAFAILLHFWNKGKIELLEECKALFLNRNNRALSILSLSQGGITATVVDIRLLLVAAIKIGAVNIILFHNHPSGSVKPSTADQQLTEKCKQAALLLDIRLTDHIIMTTDGYYSFADNGAL